MTADALFPAHSSHSPGPWHSARRIMAAAAGFALSAGWYWFPACWNMGNGAGLPFAPEYTSGQAVWTFTLPLVLLAGSLLTLLPAPALFRFRSSGPGEEAADSGVSCRGSLPFLVAQVFAWGLLLALSWPGGPADGGGLFATALGAASGNLFLLIWFCIICDLEKRDACLACGGSALVTCALYWLLARLPPSAAYWAGRFCPLFACPLLFLALPSLRCAKAESSKGVSSVSSFSYHYPYFRLPVFFAAALSLQTFLHLGGTLAIGPELRLTGYACGAFAVGGVVGRGWFSWFPSSILALFASCAVLFPLFGPTRSMPLLFLLHFAAGTGTALTLFLLGKLVDGHRSSVWNVSRALALSCAFTFLGGLALQTGISLVHNGVLSPQAVYFQLLGLAIFLLVPPLHSLALLLRPEQSEAETLSALPALEQARSGQRDHPLSDRTASLTKREIEIVRLVQSGMKNLEISTSLNIAETTLRVHLRRIYRKLGISGRTRLSSMELDLDDHMTEENKDSTPSLLP